MALIPFAEKKLIPPGANDPRIIPIGFIFHVDAGNARDLFGFFRDRSGGIESHGHIRKDGHLYQYRDTESEADANYKANSFIGADGRRYGYISIETQGYEGGEWTPEQLATIKRLIRWGYERHEIPFRVCRNPKDPGSGYHTLFGAPSAWTPISKSCPGPDRKNQFHNILAPWIRAQNIMKGAPVAEKEMPNFEERVIEELTREQELLQAIGRKVGADVKGALARAEAINKSRK